MSPTPDPRELELIAWLRDAIADVLDLDADAIDPDRPLTELGLSSRDAVGLVGDLEDHLDRDLDATLVWKTPTITLIARRLVHGDEAVAESAPAPAVAVTADDGDDDGDRVAIVGLGCRLPGGVDGPDDLWKLLLEARDAVGEVPEGRWEQFTPADAAAQAIVDATQRRGGFLDDVAGFDAEFFGITPREAELMDPQQRLLLEVAHEALLHAGIAPSSLKGTATGVFVGMCANEYSHLTTADLARIDAWTSTGSALSIAANRLSYLLDLRGPSMTTDTACSSSLVAVHQAARAIGDGDIDQAVVGGVNMLLAPAITVNFELGGALAPDGRCKPFSADADGIVRAEGCGVVVLKRLRDARRDGDRVLAVVRGTGVNSDGRSNGMMAPNPLAQEELLRDVYTRAGVDPATVDYVEAHGTGTLLGDPIEAGALATVLGTGRDTDRPLLLGSVKSNLGHLEGAAGVAGLIKLVLALQHDRLPASINYSGPNPHIRFEASRLRVVDEAQPWPRYDGVARAGVSAFGFGGTNAHIVIEEPSEHPAPLPAANTHGDDAPVTLALSARSDARVRGYAAQLAGWLRDEGRDVALRDIAHTLARRREVAPVRAAVTARGRDDLAATLAALADGLEAPGIAGPVTAPRGANTSRGEVWVFSGFGSQWPGMGAQLLDDEPAFAAAIDELEPLVQAEAGFSLRGSLLTPDPDETVDQTQVKVFAMQVALAALWRSYGREPVAVIGHSMGEVAAAVATGSLTPAEGVRVISLRSRLLQSINVLGGGAMAVMEISAEELEELGDRFPDVQIAVYAAPQQSTVAGDADQVRALAEHVESLGRNAWILNVTGAGHSAAVDPILRDLVAGLAELRPVAPSVPVYTTVHEDPRRTPAFDAAYWRDNARQAVRFRHAVAAAADDGYSEFLEVAPHPVAAASVRQTAKMRGADVIVTPTLRRKSDETITFRTHAALLAAREQAGDLTRLVLPGAQVDLPLPAWQHERFWVEHRRTAAPQGHPLLGAHVELPEGGRHLWRADVGVERLPWMADHAVHGVPVLPGAAYAEMALSAAAEVLGGDPAELVLRGLELHQVLPLGEQADVTTSVTVTAAGDARVEVHARHEGAAAGTPMVRHATAAVSRDPMPSEGWPALPQDEGAPVDLYGAFRDAGHRYGPAFVGVGDARLHADGVATAQVRLPETAAPDPHYRVHPALLDVCLQTLGVAAQAHLADRPMELYLPLGIGAMRVAADPHRGGRCVATLRALDEEANGLAGTLQLIADDGTVLLQADDVYLRRLSRDAIPAPLADKLFEAAWVQEPVGPPADATPGRWLVLAENATEHAVPVEQLARELRAAGHRIDVGGHGSEHEVADAVAALAADADRPSLGIALVAPTLATDDVGSDAARELAERLVVSIARIARVATDAELSHPVRLWVLTRGGSAIGADEAGHPALAALRAAVRVLAFEHPTLHATVVDLDADDALAHAVAELRAGAPDDEVAWRDAERHVRRLARVALDPPAADTAPPVRDGAYVVTGGLGGLGLVVARWLAESGATRIVLTGRSAPSAEAQAAIETLEALGAEVTVVRGDVARRTDVDALITAATAGELPLRGVIHAAGVLEDEVVARVTAGAVERVWAPKVIGGWNLHEATKDHDLDLWLVFSSAAALLGSPGQLAYATANAWLDALVDWRRAAGLAATTINWGAWSQVGGVAETSNALLESLSPEEGVEALDAVLRSGRAATGVVRLDARRAVELLPGLAKLAFYADLLEREAPAQADDAGDWVGIQGLRAAEPGRARQLLSDRLLERVATIMAYRPEQIDVHAPLTSLGADSLIAVRAKNAVEHDFEVGLPVRLLLQDASLADIEAYIASELGLTDHEATESPRTPAVGGQPRFVEPRDTTERWLAGVWEEVLDRRPIGVTEPLGPPADQTVADRVLARLRDRLGEEPDAAVLLADGITIEAQADLLRSKLEDNDGSPIRVLREAEDETAAAPLFLFHPAGGTTAVYQPLAELLPGDVTVIGFERIDHLHTIEEKAAFYLESIREMQPTGPYRLGGWSLGGCLAYDAARQLRAAGEEVDVVVMIDTILPDHSLVDDEQEAIRGRFERFVEYLETTYEVQLDLDVDALMELPEDEQITRFMEAVATSGLGMSAGVLEHQRTSYVDARIAERYHPQPYDGRVVLYRASDRGLTTTLDPRYARQEESLGWDLLCSALEVVRVTGDHTQIIDRPNVDIIAEHLGVVFTESVEVAQVAELAPRRQHDPAHRFRRGADRPTISAEPRRDVAL